MADSLPLRQILLPTPTIEFPNSSSSYSALYPYTLPNPKGINTYYIPSKSPFIHPQLKSSIMYYPYENNPHFIQPQDSTRPPHDHSPIPVASPPHQQPQQASQPPSHMPNPQVPLSTVTPFPRSQRRQPSFPRRDTEDHYPIHNQNQPRPSSPSGVPATQQDLPERPRRTRRGQGQVQLVEPAAPPRQITPPAPRAPLPQRKQTITLPVEQSTEPEGIDGGRHSQNLRIFPPQKARFPTWCLAIFCAIFWLIIIVGGLIVLVVYLVFRPHMPRFDIPAASLNAAYLDLGSYLNADVTLLVNFTNPNKKVSVDFSSVILDLYYGNNPIATQYIEPFSAGSHESRFVHAHMISSEVRLPLADSQRLSAQLESDGLVMFEVRGLFRTRSNLGTLLRYSYWLYGHCTIALTGPPAGVLRASKCLIKR